MKIGFIGRGRISERSGGPFARPSAAAARAQARREAGKNMGDIVKDYL